MDFEDCVSKGELAAVLSRHNELAEKLNLSLATMTNSIRALTSRMDALERRGPPPVHDDEQEYDDDLVDDASGQFDPQARQEHRQRRRLRRNRAGMGAFDQNYRAHDDPYAKVKFSIPPFHGEYDAEKYLDWEMMVE